MNFLWNKFNPSLTVSWKLDVTNVKPIYSKFDAFLSGKLYDLGFPTYGKATLFVWKVFSVFLRPNEQLQRMKFQSKVSIAAAPLRTIERANSFIPGNKRFPLKPRVATNLTCAPRLPSLPFSFSPLPFSLFGLPLPTPFAICIQLEREPTNPLRPSKIIQPCMLYRYNILPCFASSILLLSFNHFLNPYTHTRKFQRTKEK